MCSPATPLPTTRKRVRRSEGIWSNGKRVSSARAADRRMRMRRASRCRAGCRARSPGGDSAPCGCPISHSPTGCDPSSRWRSLPPRLSAQASWDTLKVETTASFRGLSVVDDRVVWASGTRGTVIRTTDGGNTWRVDSLPGAATFDLRGIHARNANVAHVAATAGRIWRTTDGGRTWSLRYQAVGHDACSSTRSRSSSDQVGIHVRRSDGRPVRHPRHAGWRRHVERGADEFAPRRPWTARRRSRPAARRSCSQIPRQRLARHRRLGGARLPDRRRRRELDGGTISHSPTRGNRRRVFGRVCGHAARRGGRWRLRASRFFAAAPRRSPAMAG